MISMTNSIRQKGRKVSTNCLRQYWMTKILVGPVQGDGQEGID